LRTRPFQSGGSGFRTRRSRLMRPRWALAHPRRSSSQLQVPVSIRTDRPYESQLSTCSPASPRAVCSSFRSCPYGNSLMDSSVPAKLK